MKFLLPLALLLVTTVPAWALEGAAAPIMNVPPLYPAALLCVAIFVLAYIGVVFEEKTQMRKCKPVMLAAAFIWIVIALIAPKFGVSREELHTAVSSGLEEYGALLLFLLCAMTYINALEDRDVFAALRSKLVKAGLNLRQLFWVTGVIAFFLSSVADNMTTALVLGAVVMAVGKNDPKFVAMGCINVVIAANAGGAFCPFGDITTLMVWQAGHVSFFEFFDLFIPSAVNFLVPALCMHLFIPDGMPEAVKEDIRIKRGGKATIVLGVLTIATAVTFEQVLGLPPFLGMMAGLSVLMMLAYYTQVRGRKEKSKDVYDVLGLVNKAEWDTLLFFFGVIFCVSGLSYLGYMTLASHAMFDNLGPSVTNVLLGLSSAVIDNIPVMFAVLTMHPDMSHFQWLLVTLTTGTGGSLLSVGSAAGVALMGIARGKYTFSSHLKWTPVIALGYAASILAHFLVNGHMQAPDYYKNAEQAPAAVEAPVTP
jgi:Na+/H+ antiporter NhaD/arsenite permease-like protein